ncbi:MAG: sigma-54-dependent Fis family transcriptional regulator [Candidatus Delongbacteria bacterium]|nr:sigma-54-dependent Fis family transcriptional regulator [Candidatus Delongbacteria bacterium]
MIKHTILIVDDEQNQRDTLAGFLRKRGYEVLTAESGKEALALVREQTVDLAISDLRMPEMSGLELLTELRELQPEIVFILITAFGSVENAVEAMKKGAAHYLTKPVDLEELELTLRDRLEHQRLLRENRELKEALQTRRTPGGFIAASGEMQEILNLAYRAAPSRATLLIIGESGTGKEQVARLVHDLSSQKEGPFVPVNVAAIPETLIESELFGHEKGSFTGANARRIGLLEQADKGTLFIDEVGDIPLPVQVKLLRTLQENCITRVGGRESIALNLRFIAATHRDLALMVEEQMFREDLYYRLNVIAIPLPPLRKRKSDIPALIEHFVESFSRLNGKEAIDLTREAMDLLLKYHYPGNVRELENAIERAVVLCRDNVIQTTDLPLTLRSEGRSELPEPAGDSLPEIVESVERRLVYAALEKAGGNKSKAARSLGLTEKNIRDRLKKWGTS